jgi:hypothetical protein
MAKTSMEVDKSTLDHLKNVAKKSQTYDQLLNQRITCNAAGCQKKGSIEINLDVGKFGTITLYVCPTCVGKFQG